MIKTIDQIINEECIDGKKHVKEIILYKESDYGPIKEDTVYHKNDVCVKIELKPTDGYRFDKLESEKTFEIKGDSEQEYLIPRAQAANFIHDFEKKYCQEDLESRCTWHKLYHNSNSTTGEGMRTSIEMGKGEAGAYKCSVCNGYAKSCSKYAGPVRSMPDPAHTPAITCGKEYSLSEK